jgi:S-adenosylmethionine hydrolase
MTVESIKTPRRVAIVDVPWRRHRSPTRRINVSKPVVFVSDLGLRDEFVGVCHAVIARIAPDSRVIDISHGITPHDMRAGALILAECLRFAPTDAIGLAIVDPGVGTARIPIAVETAAGHHLVGPDNGVLSLSWRADGGPLRAVSITSPDVVLMPISSVFHGRDVFAPAAAHLAAGMDLDGLGPQVPVESLVELKLAEPEVERGRIVGEVLDIDRFGNVRLNIRPAHLKAAGLDDAAVLEIATTGQVARCLRVASYGQVEVGAYGILVDAWEWMAIMRYEANAAADLGVRAGDPIWLKGA